MAEYDLGQVAGPQGAKGDTGAAGPQGPQGVPGATGPQGIQGEQGPKGDKGDTGGRGPQGETGLTGPQGPQGPTGPTGPKGDQGIPGPNSVTAGTGTTLTGLLKGNGAAVTTATPGVDYVAANDYAHLATPLTTGSGNAYTLTLDPPLTAYTPGLMLAVNFHTANSGGECTLNVNGLGAKYIYPYPDRSYTPRAFSASIHVVVYDGVYWRMMDNSYLPLGGGGLSGNIFPLTANWYSLGNSEQQWANVYANNGVFGTNLTVGGNTAWHGGNLPISTYKPTLLNGWYGYVTVFVIGNMASISARVTPPSTSITSSNNRIFQLPNGMRFANIIEAPAVNIGNFGSTRAVQAEGQYVVAFSADWPGGLRSFSFSVEISRN